MIEIIKILGAHLFEFCIILIKTIGYQLYFNFLKFKRFILFAIGVFVINK